jgi:Arc/MetJ-type ribon-helix-helix transcriptional regulator
VSILNVRVSEELAAFLERVTRQTGQSKSEVVREALEHLREQEIASPAETLAHLIGCWDSGGQQLSERTGERFARLLKEQRDDGNSRGRRAARRPA